MGCIWPKYIKFELKKVQRSYIPWKLSVMYNLKKNWLVIWKMTRGIWKIFTRAYESLKFETLMACFCLKLNMYDLKNYRRVMCHDNEDWCKNWIGTDLAVQNWHEEFDKFWPEHFKISKTCTLMGCFWPKYVMFEPRVYVWW